MGVSRTSKKNMVIKLVHQIRNNTISPQLIVRALPLNYYSSQTKLSIMTAAYYAYYIEVCASGPLLLQRYPTLLLILEVSVIISMSSMTFSSM